MNMISDVKPAFDVEAIRAQFPLLGETVRGKKLVFLDSAASIFSAAVYQGDLAYNDEKGNPIPEKSDGVKSAWDYSASAASAGITAGLQQFSDSWNSAFANGAFATVCAVVRLPGSRM